MADIIITFIFCCVPLVFFIFIIILIISLSSQKIKNPNNSGVIDYLKSKKAEGYKTLDELIDYESSLLEPKEAIKPPAKPEEQNIIHREEVLPDKGWSISSAEILLYLGSFLITFAMLVLVALGWDNIADLFKLFILGFTVFTFLLAGIGLNFTKKLKNVGSTYITIGSLGLILFFMGIWNFALSYSNLIKFEYYWVFASVLYFISNILLYKFFEHKRFFYLLILSIYSFIISLSFSITVQAEFRIVSIAVLNLALYFTNQAFGLNNKGLIQIVSRITNYILNIFIIFIILNLYSEIVLFSDKLVALLSISIGTLFIAITFFTLKAKFETASELILLIIKSLIISSLFSNSIETISVIVGIIGILYLVLSEVLFARKSYVLNILTKIIIAFIIIGINILLAANWIFSNSFEISNIYIFILGFISIILIFYIPLRYKIHSLTGIISFYLLFLLTRLIDLLFDFNLNFYIYLYLILGVFLSTAYIFAKRSAKDIIANIIYPLTEGLPFITIFFSIIANINYLYAIVFLVISSIYLIRSILFNNKILLTLAYLFFGCFIVSLLHYMDKISLLEVSSLSQYSIFLSFFALIIFFIEEYKDSLKTEAFPEIVNIGLFSAIALMLSLESREVMLFNFIVLLIFSLIRLCRKSGFLSALSSFSIIQIITLTLCNLNNLNFETTMYILTGMNIVILIKYGLFLNFFKNKFREKYYILIPKVNRLSYLNNGALLVINFFVSKEIILLSLLGLFAYGILSAIKNLSKIKIFVLTSLLYLILIQTMNIYERSFAEIILGSAILTAILMSLILIINFIKRIREIINKSILNFSNNLISIIALAAGIIDWLLFILLKDSIFYWDQEVLIAFAILIFGLSLIMSKNSSFQKLSGLLFVLGIWILNDLNSFALQFYIVPLTLYGLIIAYIFHKEKAFTKSLFIETSAYLIQFSTLFLQSIFLISNQERLFAGLSLIGLNVIVIIFGLFRQKKIIWISSLVFLILELIVRFYMVILIIPWWIYIGFIGIALILIASYIIYKKQLG